MCKGPEVEAYCACEHQGGCSWGRKKGVDDELRQATELTWPPLRLQYGLSPLREWQPLKLLSKGGRWQENRLAAMGKLSWEQGQQGGWRQDHRKRCWLLGRQTAAFWVGVSMMLAGHAVQSQAGSELGESRHQWRLGLHQAKGGNARSPDR